MKNLKQVSEAVMARRHKKEGNKGKLRKYVEKAAPKFLDLYAKTYSKEDGADAVQDAPDDNNVPPTDGPGGDGKPKKDKPDGQPKDDRPNDTAGKSTEPKETDKPATERKDAPAAPEQPAEAEESKSEEKSDGEEAQVVTAAEQSKSEEKSDGEVTKAGMVDSKGRALKGGHSPGKGEVATSKQAGIPKKRKEVRQSSRAKKPRTYFGDSPERQSQSK